MKRALAAAFSVALVALGWSCREPTQITLVLTTDVDCATVTKTQTEIAIGTRTSLDDGTAQNTSAPSCTGKDIGSLAVVPSGNGDTVAIAVYLSTNVAKPSSACRTDPTGCITARRVIGYVSHTPLTLPVELTQSCIGVSCGAEQTCVAGKCVSDTVDVTRCQSGVCGSDTLVPPADGGVPDAIADASTDVKPDACVDCGGSCVDLATSTKNCGTCGFDCGAGECIGGACRLIPKAKKADDFAEVGCLTYFAGTDEVFWTRTTAGDRGVHRVAAIGSALSTVYFNGNVGEGISSNGTVIAFTAASAGTTLFQCDPTKNTSLCSQRTNGTITGASKYVVTRPEVAESFALYTSLVMSTLPNDDFSTTNGIGPFAATVGQYAFYRKPLGGPELVSVTLPVTGSSGYGLGGPVTAMTGDSKAATLFVAVGNEILALVGNALAPRYSGLPSTPTQLAVEPNPSPNLYWAATEGNAQVVYRATASGGQPPLKLYATPLPIQCLVASKDALFWLSAGVPYRAHK